MRALLLSASILVMSQITASAVAQTADKLPMNFNEYKEAVNMVSIQDHTMPWETFTKMHGKPGLAILDLRSEEDYKQGHIKGAVHMGADITAERLKQLVPDKNSTIVIYCTNTFVPSRMIALNYACLPQIVALDYPKVFVLEDVWHKNFEAVQKLQSGPMWESGTKAKLPTSESK